MTAENCPFALHDLCNHGSPIPSGESPFGPLDENGHDGHAPQLNGLLADCPGCATSSGVDQP